MFAQGTVGRSLVRGVESFVLFAIPLVMAGNPAWGQMTIGSILFAIVHYIEGQATQS